MDPGEDTPTMKIPGLTMSDPLAQQVVRHGTPSLVSGVECEATVAVERAFLQHGPASRNYRPYLHLAGELRSLRPVATLQVGADSETGIDEFTFREKLGPTVDAFYEFTPKQLLELVSKGYFSGELQTPDDLVNTYVLPVSCDVLLLAPEPGSDDVPVAIVVAHHLNDLSVSQESSGYELAYHWQPVLELDDQLLRDGDDVTAPRTFEALDLGIDLSEMLAPTAEEAEESTASKVAAAAAAATVVEEEPAPRSVYEMLVAPLVHNALKPAEPEQDEHPQLIDLLEDLDDKPLNPAEIGVKPIQIAPTSPATPRRSAPSADESEPHFGTAVWPAARRGWQGDSIEQDSDSDSPELS